MLIKCIETSLMGGRGHFIPHISHVFIQHSLSIFEQRWLWLHRNIKKASSISWWNKSLKQIPAAGYQQHPLLKFPRRCSRLLAKKRRKFKLIVVGFRFQYPLMRNGLPAPAPHLYQFSLWKSLETLWQLNMAWNGHVVMQKQLNRETNQH